MVSRPQGFKTLESREGWKKSIDFLTRLDKGQDPCVI